MAQNLRDIEFVEQIRNGDLQAENELYEGFREHVERMIRIRMRAQPHDQEDLVSEIWMAVIRNLRRGFYDGSAPLVAYINGIVYRQVGNYFRCEKKKPAAIEHGQLHSEIPDSSNIELEVERKELRRILRQGIEKLKLKYKEILYLRYYQEMSYDEISMKLMLPLSKVKGRLHRAKKILEDEIRKSKGSVFFSNMILYFANIIEMAIG